MLSHEFYLLLIVPTGNTEIMLEGAVLRVTVIWYT